VKDDRAYGAGRSTQQRKGGCLGTLNSMIVIHDRDLPVEIELVKARCWSRMQQCHYMWLASLKTAGVVAAVSAEIRGCARNLTQCDLGNGISG
jgi:hypothetical protein